MKHGIYTLFGSKSGRHEDAQLIVETADKSRYLAAKEWATKNGYVITSEYVPETELSKPDFSKTI